MSLFVVLVLRRRRLIRGGAARLARLGFRDDVTLLLRLRPCPRILLLKFCNDSVIFGNYLADVRMRRVVWNTCENSSTGA
jgi:hypothetical protein